MIHSYIQNGYHIVLDTYSGSVHLVDPVAYDIINLYETRGREDIVREICEKYADDPDVDADEVRACLDDIEVLKEQGKLFSKDIFAGLETRLKAGKTEIKALCLHLAHTCNLNCSYCFASQGKYHGERALMSFEVGKQALDFLAAQSGKHVNLEVDFFGGEPLMDLQVMKDLVAYARSIEKAAGKRFRFTLTTNGVLVDDDVIDFANREMNNVVMSLDGRREVHDRFRVDLSGRGSYDRIVPRFQEFARRRGERDYYIRGTYTHYNTDFVNDIRHMADLGFTRLSMEPVVCDPSDPCALTGEDLPVLMQQYEELADYMLERRLAGQPITFYHYMIDLSHGPCIYKRLSGCGSGVEYMAVTPWGDLYPCHQFVGEERFKMGDVWNGVTEEAVREDFRSCNIAARPECRDCWAKLYCSGGCAANAWHASGSIRGIYEYGCELFKKRMECAIWLQLAEKLLPDGSERAEEKA